MEQGRSEAGLVELDVEPTSTHRWGLSLRLKVWQLPGVALPVGVLQWPQSRFSVAQALRLSVVPEHTNHLGHQSPHIMPSH